MDTNATKPNSVSVIEKGVVKYTCETIYSKKEYIDHGGIMIAFNTKANFTIGSTLYQYNGDKTQE